MTYSQGIDETTIRANGCPINKTCKWVRTPRGQNYEVCEHFRGVQDPEDLNPVVTLLKVECSLERSLNFILDEE